MPIYSTLSKKNTYNFTIGCQHHLTISSDFDSGNISLIKQVNELQYRLQSVPDDFASRGRKAWFYFSVKVEKQVKVKFIIQNVFIYESMYQEQNWPKPVYRVGLTDKWSTLQQSYLIYRDEVQLIINYQFNTQQPVYFAMTVPFAYYDMENYLNHLRFTVPEMIDYQDQVIRSTKTGKNLHMLTIEDKQLKQHKNDSNHKRSIILITSRVHPGEVSSTFCLMGMLQFILKPFSLQSQILRKMFTFIVIPIVNPDGVYEGNYRMDLNAQNLNRAYLQPDYIKQQSFYIIFFSETVHAIKSHLQQRIKTGDRIVFHFDLHAHSSMKRSFIYGNAFDDIIQQTETQIFCKLLDKNCCYFQENMCQFGEKHMKFKDRGEMMSKQGCARVVLSKMANITYSYTIESSIFPVQSKNYLSQKYEKCVSPVNLDFKIVSKDQNSFPFVYDDFEDSTNKYSSQPNIIDQNRNLGINIMLSILDLMMKNPFSSANEKQFDQMRKQVASRILQSQERFKMLDTKAYHKSKFISHFAKLQFQSKFKSQWVWLAQCSQFQNIQWPQGFVWFQKQIVKKKTKKISKLKTQGRQQRIYTRIENQPLYLIKLPNQAKSNRLRLQTQKPQLDQLKGDCQRLPIIGRSLEQKKMKTQAKQDISPQKKIQKIEQMKIANNIFETNRSNILLTFLEDIEEKKQRKISKKRITSLKMASINRCSAHKPVIDERINEIIFQSIQTDLHGLKPSHSQGQFAISVFGEPQKHFGDDGQEFEDKRIMKNHDAKKSRKQLISRKISMLKKANENKKITTPNKNCLMRLPQLGKAFLVTNAKKNLQKLKTSVDKCENDERSTIQSNQKNYMKDFLHPYVNSILKLKTQTSIV